MLEQRNQTQTMADLNAAARNLPADMPFPQLARFVADAVLASTLGDPLWSLQTIIWVALPNHLRVQLFLEARYEEWIAHWATTYEQLAVRYDLRLRAGVTWLDVADCARVRGMAMGAVANLSSGDSVVVGAVRAMMPALSENVEKTR